MLGHRDSGNDDLVLDACLAVLSQTGFAELRLQTVARRAGVPAGLVEDRWRDTSALAVAAILRLINRPSAADADTGGLRGDLLHQCRLMVVGLGDLPPGVLAALAVAHHTNPELCDALEDAHGGVGARLPPAVLERARAREELAPGNPATAYTDVAAPVLVGRMIAEQRIDDRFVERLVDDFVLPAYRHERDADR